MKFNDVVELLKNKRYRSILILIGYFIFFIIIAVMFRNSSPRTTIVEEKKTPLEKYCQMANFEYVASYDIDSVTFEIEGKTFRTDTNFKKDDKEYYIKDGLFYELDEDSIIETGLDFDYYDSKSLCDLFNKASLVSKSEDYENNSIINKFSVLDENRDDKIYISYSVKGEVIDKVMLDLSNEDTKYLIEIEYKNIGQVSNFTSIFDEGKVIKGVEE